MYTRIIKSILAVVFCLSLLAPSSSMAQSSQVELKINLPGVADSLGLRDGDKLSGKELAKLFAEYKGYISSDWMWRIDYELRRVCNQLPSIFNYWLPESETLECMWQDIYNYSTISPLDALKVEEFIEKGIISVTVSKDNIIIIVDLKHAESTVCTVVDVETNKTNICRKRSRVQPLPVDLSNPKKTLGRTPDHR